jgi:hypothetical protein
MSEVVSRRALSVRVPQTAVSQSQKRKSSDEETENISPNVSSKKAKSKFSDESSSIVPASELKPKTGIAKYSRPQKLANGGGNTPGKSINKGINLPGTPMTASKKSSSQTPKGTFRVLDEKIGAFFDEGFTITEARLNEIMSAIMGKGKGSKKQPGTTNYKEKAEKYEVVIKELRDSVRKILSDIPIVRKKSVAHETFISGQILEMNAGLQEAEGQRDILETKETLLQQQLKNMTNELKSSSSLAETLKREHSPLRNRSNEVQTRYAELQSKFFEEESRRKFSDKELANLEAKLASTLLTMEITQEQHKNVRRNHFLSYT